MTPTYIKPSLSQRYIGARLNFHEYYLPSNGELAFVSPDEKQIQIFSEFTRSDIEPFQKVTLFGAPDVGLKRYTEICTVSDITPDVVNFVGPMYRNIRTARRNFSDKTSIEPLTALNLQEVRELIFDWYAWKKQPEITRSLDLRPLKSVNNYPDMRCRLFYYEGKLTAYAIYSLAADVGLDKPLASLYARKTIPNPPSHYTNFVDSVVTEDIYNECKRDFYLDFGGSMTESLRNYKLHIFPVAFEYSVTFGSADTSQLNKLNIPQ